MKLTGYGRPANTDREKVRDHALSVASHGDPRPGRRRWNGARHRLARPHTQSQQVGPAKLPDLPMSARSPLVCPYATVHPGGERGAKPDGNRVATVPPRPTLTVCPVRRHLCGNVHRTGPTGHPSLRTRPDVRRSRWRFLLRDAHNGASVRVTLFGRRTHRPHEGGKGSPLRSQDGEVHDPSEPCSKNPQHEDEHHRASSIAPTDHRLFSTVRAALMSGNLVSDCSGVMSIPTNAATKPKVKSMSRLPRMPARPPHHKVPSACSLVRRAVWKSFTFGLLRSLMVAARHGYRARR